ncbi:MAG TPA: MBL fold metallo-hydrolase [Candidatus Saccharimonadales bacterium]|jgi:L-ascorbate metabolism protein UlaG (beta-lactamase superfamily)|nr:MBL fold metallo-hydrolase [Candidatus Saccharimonadales bacterium]
MFDIEYKGGNGVVISTKKLNAVIDPKLSVVGLKDIPVKDVLEIATEARFASGSKDAQLAIEGPGDYELGPYSVKGIPAIRHLDTSADEKIATIYRIEVGDTRIALIGNISPKLNEDQLEELGIVDVLILPVGGGGYTLDATSAAGLVRQIDPKVIIPVHYADDALTYEVPQDTLETFVKELGAPVEITAKYKVKSVSLLPAVLTVVELTRS